jgi:hypothetical protein
MMMGTLGGDRTTFRFDDRDDPVEEISEHSDDGGSHKRHSRSVYNYDAEGNWTEREVGTVEPSQDYLRLNIERRQITYYPPEPC